MYPGSDASRIFSSPSSRTTISGMYRDITASEIWEPSMTGMERNMMTDQYDPYDKLDSSTG